MVTGGGGDCKLCWFDGEREEERWERKERSELFISFDVVVYIVLRSCM